MFISTRILTHSSDGLSTSFHFAYMPVTYILAHSRKGRTRSTSRVVCIMSLSAAPPRFVWAPQYYRLLLPLFSESCTTWSAFLAFAPSCSSLSLCESTTFCHQCWSFNLAFLCAQDTTCTFTLFWLDSSLFSPVLGSQWLSLCKARMCVCTKPPLTNVPTHFPGPHLRKSSYISQDARHSYPVDINARNLVGVQFIFAGAFGFLIFYFNASLCSHPKLWLRKSFYSVSFTYCLASNQCISMHFRLQRCLTRLTPPTLPSLFVFLMWTLKYCAPLVLLWPGCVVLCWRLEVSGYLLKGEIAFHTKSCGHMSLSTLTSSALHTHSWRTSALANDSGLLAAVRWLY